MPNLIRPPGAVARRASLVSAACAALLLAGGSFCPALSETPEEAVERLFPQRLIDESEADFAAGGPTPFRASDFEVGDLDRDGGEQIVAAYTNGFSAAIRVIERVASDWVLADEPDIPRLGGVLPKVALLDVDADGSPEAFVSFSSARGPSADWLLDWDGDGLEPIGPTDDGDTLLSDTDLVDLDGDGIVELIVPTGSGPVAPDETEEIGFGDFEVYAFDGDGFVAAGPVVIYGAVERGTGAPVAESTRFRASDPGGDYLLRIVNGTSAGAERVSSALVQLNGEVVAGPSGFSQQVAEIVVAVSLEGENLLEIELRGKPGGRISYTIEPPG